MPTYKSLYDSEQHIPDIDLIVAPGEVFESPIEINNPMYEAVGAPAPSAPAPPEEVAPEEVEPPTPTEEV